MNAWTFLFIAGVCEIGWPLGFKLANDFLNLRWGFIAFSVVSMILSGFFFVFGSASYSDRYGLCRMDGNRCSRDFYRRCVFI